VSNAEYIFVQPAMHKGYPLLCPLVRKTSKECNNGLNKDISFEFQKKRYFWNTKKGVFEKLRWGQGLTVSHLVEIEGYTQPSEVETCISIYGLNR
jgi:hypothetical protein